MATVTLIVLLLALNSISVSSLRHSFKRLGPQPQNVWCPAECTQPTANPCQPNPCLYGGQCALTTDQKDYRCLNCPHPTGGKNCAELTCGPDCFKVGDSVYFIYPNTQLVISSSYSKCHGEGMTLATIKNPSVHDEVRKHLRAREVNHQAYWGCYWIGLSRPTSAEPWKWVDGTDLGTYQPWRSHPTSGVDCVDICSHGYSFNFTGDYCCPTSTKYQYFSLCEKTLPVILD